MFKRLKQGDNIYFFRMLAFVRPYKFRYIFGQGFYSMQGFAFPFIMSMLSGWIMTAMVAGNPDMVVSAVANVGILIAAFIILLGLGIYVHIMTTERVMMNVKQRLFRTFVQSGLEDATQSHSGEGIASINTDANTASGIIHQSFTNFIDALWAIFGSAAVIFVVDWRLGLAAVGVGALSFFFQYRFTGPIAKIGKERLDANAETVKTVSNIFSGAIATRAYSMHNKALVTFDADNGRLKLLDIRRGVVDTWRTVLTRMEQWLSLVVTFAFGGWLVATNRMELGSLMIAFGMFTNMVGGIGRIGATYAELQVPIAGAKRIFAVLDKGLGIEIRNQKSEIRDIDGYGLRLEDFSFTYRDAQTPVLSGINLEIGENEMVAFVGESGSGKSTLLRAVMGMYEREDLGLSLGGMSFHDTSQKDWRANFAYVDQSCKLFDMSVKENIAMGKGGAASDEEVIHAAKRAAAHDFITELEGGYDAPCGEKGSTLSGGQKQRIAIGRALVRKAPILVFDEATSALDKDSERQIMETIEALRKDHTVLITTHNLESIVGADRIVVLDGGRIDDVGTHEQLLAKGGLYKRLYSQIK